MKTPGKATLPRALNEFPEWRSISQRNSQFSGDLRRVQSRINDIQKAITASRTINVEVEAEQLLAGKPDAIGGPQSFESDERELRVLRHKESILKAAIVKLGHEMETLRDELSFKICKAVSDEHRAIVRKISLGLVSFGAALQELSTFEQRLSRGGVSFSGRLTVPLPVSGSPLAGICWAGLLDFLALAEKDGLIRTSEIPESLRPGYKAE